MGKAANDNSGPLGRPEPQVSARKCPICGKPATIEAMPFCSKRCADVDLHRWLGEGYRVPGDRDVDASEAEDES